MRLGLGIMRDWGYILTESEDNPFPLAPRDMIERGEITSETYRAENARWAHFFRPIMRKELSELDGGHIEILGFGRGRDLEWVPEAVGMGFSIAIRDGNEVAIRNARRFALLHGIRDRVSISQGDVLDLWERRRISNKRTTAFYGCQFIEHQDELLPEYMARFGNFLRRKSAGRVYLTLPRAEDNEGVNFNTSIPPSDGEWQTPLTEAANGYVQIQVLGQHSYFDRKYTLFRIGKA